MTLPPPIVVPDNWTTEQDLRFYAERWEEDAPSVGDGLHAAMIFHCGGLVEIVNAALDYFHQHDLTLYRFPLSCLSLNEKLDILDDIAATSHCGIPHRARLQDDISLCRWADAERTRIFREHYRCRGESWIYPVVAVIDLCGAAAYALWETMSVEYDDFRGDLIF